MNSARRLTEPNRTMARWRWFFEDVARPFVRARTWISWSGRFYIRAPAPSISLRSRLKPTTTSFNLRKPTIAAVEGYAVAGGFELMISCDFALASTEAKIGDFHMRRALFGGAGPIYRLPRMIGMRRAKELMLTGKLLTGEQCADWGIGQCMCTAGAL